MSKPKANAAKSKKPKKKADGFERMRDLRPGEIIHDPPAVFSGEFRLARRIACRAVHRYGVFREGSLYVYVNKANVSKNRVWRTIDLAKAAVQYRKRDRKILMTTTEKFKLTVKEPHFQQWLDNLMAHRLYSQSKSTSVLPTKQARSRKLAIVHAPISLPATIADERQSVSAVQLPVTGPTQEPQDSSKKSDAIVSPVATTSVRDQVPSPVKSSIMLKRSVQTKASAKLHQGLPTSPPAPIAVVERSKLYEDRASSMTPAKWPSIASVKPPSPPLKHAAEKTPSPSLSPAGSSTDKVATVAEQRTIESDESAAKSTVKTTMPVDEPRTGAISETIRKELPAPMAPPPSLFKLVMSAIGKDVMRMTLPAAMMEPIGMLQVLCEELEYSSLIDAAVAETTPHKRMLHVAAFAMSRYGSTANRAGRKPFNPLLGETFEYAHPRLGWRYVAEQVQHHPAISACHAEGRGWRFWQDCELAASLSATAVKAKPIGDVYLHLEKWKETYQWNKVTSQVTGILSGTYTIDHLGEMTVSCQENALTCKLTFKKMTNKVRGEVQGCLQDDEGDTLARLEGNWTSSLYVGPRTDPDRYCIWRLAAMPPDHERYYGMTEFAIGLNELRPDAQGPLPRTDSRYRPDQKALELGNAEEADQQKKELEERQRQRRKANESRKISHTPVWFRRTGITDPEDGLRWEFGGNYWNAKKTGFKDIDFLDLW